MDTYNKALKQPARHLRNNMTDAERQLWNRLRRKQIHDLQFYRQKPLLDFIVDFYCPKTKLVIEVDGGQHFTPEHGLKDENRDRKLQELGIHVLRFNNLQVMKEADSVVEIIRLECERRL